LGHNILEALKYPVLIAEDDGVLLLVSILENTFDLFIDEDKLLGLFG
jgi:hypothetical protein